MGIFLTDVEMDLACRYSPMDNITSVFSKRIYSMEKVFIIGTPDSIFLANLNLDKRFQDVLKVKFSIKGDLKIIKEVGKELAGIQLVRSTLAIG
jgi:hypothetical protein